MKVQLDDGKTSVDLESNHVTFYSDILPLVIKALKAMGCTKEDLLKALGEKDV